MVRQKNLSVSMMIVFITFMNMFIPLSTDLYLPALPEMHGYFGASEFLIGLTLTVFFFTFAISIVIFGPLSDKYGRKKVLIFGTLIYTIFSLFCALSVNVYMLIIGRFFQAVGSGAIITIATALIKDCFRGNLMTKILAITQALGVIGPMAAPLLGGFLLNFTSWRGAFFALTILGAVNLWLAFLLTETLPKEDRYSGGVLESLSLLGKLAKQKQFMLTVIMFAIPITPFMAYLSVSSFVYVETFSLTAQEYSYFFALNSSVSILGPFMYLRMKSFMSNERILQTVFLVAALSGVAVLTAGHWSAIGFLLSFLPFTAIGAMMRPFAMEVLLNKVRDNIGTAASMINFVPNLFGSIGMMLGTLPWGDFISGLGIIILSATALTILLFKFVEKI